MAESRMDSVKVITKPYRLTRTEMARVAAEECVRRFWWFVAIVPTFGIILLIFGSGPLQILGFLAVLWPFSIPARSVVTTSKSSRLFTVGCHIEATEEELTIIGEYDKNQKRLRSRVPVNRFKEAVRRGDLMIVRSRLPGFLPIRLDAFESDAEVQMFIDLIQPRNQIEPSA